MTVSNEFSSVRQYDERIGYTKYYIKPQFSLLAKGLGEECSVEKTDQAAGKSCECQEQRTGDQWIALEGKRSVPFSLIISVHGIVSGTYF